MPEREFFDLRGDHVQRYVWAGELSANADILDVGCGHGYGTDYLARKSSGQTVGIDTDAEAIKWAMHHYHRPNLRFLLVDALDLHFPVGSFDLCTSFEVFEHVVDPKLFLKNIAKVLRPGGTLFISTPNLLFTNQFYRKGRSPFLFHVKEYYPAELESLLHSEFTVDERYSQVSRHDSVDRKLLRYSSSFFIPPAIRRLFPSFLKVQWLRMRGMPLPVVGKWEDYQLVQRDANEFTSDDRTLILQCRVKK